MVARRRLLILGNPQNRRVVDFQRALRRRGFPEAPVLSYERALEHPDSLEAQLTPDTLLRLDSPGENERVTAQLLRWGAEACLPDGALRVDASDVAALAGELAADRGRIRAPAQLAAGFARFLDTAETLLEERGAGALAPPPRITELIDKRRCHARLASAGLRQPRRLDAPQDYEGLRDAMRGQGLQRVFVKLRHGSSASGVVALRTRKGAVQATTSVELAGSLDESALYNSLRIHRYDSEKEVAAIVDALAREGVVVEPWIPKESDESGRAFDLRILCIAGEPAHTVVRSGAGPITNLHLGNRRGSLPALRERLGAEVWSALGRAARDAAAVYSDCLHLGLDLLVARGSRVPYVIEANAFGDLLPGVLWEGLDAYAAQLQALESGWGAPR